MFQATDEVVFQYTVGDHKGEDKLDQNRFGDIQLDANVRKYDT